MAINTNADSSWIPINNGLPEDFVPGRLAAGKIGIIASKSSVIYISKDNGAHWIRCNNELYKMRP
jgi:hypothetical protein